MKQVVKRFHELTVMELYDLLKLRFDVFVLEQACFYPELDNCDQEALHVWLEDEKGITAYLRVMDCGVKNRLVTIGRVVTEKRGCGLGAEVMHAGIAAARDIFHADQIYIEAQCHAQGFYEKLGFHVVSEPFVEDGIPHVRMLLD